MLTLSLLSLWSGALLILIKVHSSACSECNVYYLDQPINEFHCNPFLSGVRLDCSIYINHTNDKNYDIYWYKIPMGVEKADPELVNTYRVYKDTKDNYYGGKLIKSPFHIQSRSLSATNTGIYWCQVVLLDESGHASSNGSFRPSSPFLLHSRDKYSSFLPCSDLYQSQPQPTCARSKSPFSTTQPPATPDRVFISPDQIVTSVFSQGSVTDSNSNNLPPWGYAVIAGGGVASMIIITVILCILLVFCQTLQKYKARPPLELENAATAGHSSTHGQPVGRHLFPTRSSDVSTARVLPYHITMVKHEPDTSDYFEMRPVSTRGMAIAGPPSISAFQAGTEGIMALPRGDEWRKSSRRDHRDSSSTASSSTVEINDHIYHTIDQLELEAYHSRSPTAENSDNIATHNVPPRLLCRSFQNLRGSFVPESLAKPKTPPPRLLNSPKSTACLKASKLPLVPSSQSVRIIASSVTTIAETTRRSPPAVSPELKQKQHQAQSAETNDYVSLCSTPRTSAVMS